MNIQMRINVEVFTRDMKGLASGFNSGNAFLDEFIKSDEAFDAGIGKIYRFLIDLKVANMYYDVRRKLLEKHTHKNALFACESESAMGSGERGGL